MGFESPSQEPSQEQLAQDYLKAYEVYKDIDDRTMNHLRILDKLRDEVAPQNMIDEEEKLFKASHEEGQRAMERYVTIGERLTPETKDKYLR